MQISTFVIPILNPSEAQKELNQFLGSHRGLEVQSQLASSNASHYRCYSVHWLPSQTGKSSASSQRKRIDYREVLDEKTFIVFARLRECRKQIAQEESVPAYVIFTDAELAELAKLDELTQQSMQTVSGVGSKKALRYAERFIAFMGLEVSTKDHASGELS